MILQTFSSIKCQTEYKAYTPSSLVGDTQAHTFLLTIQG